MATASARPQPAPPDRLRRWLRARTPADAALAGLLGFAAVVVLVETRGMSFFADDWDFVVYRRGFTPHELLTPHGPHMSLVPILIYKFLLQVFGGNNYLPFRIVAVLDLLGLSTLIGFVARRNWGPWWGLVPVLLFVTLGQAGTSTLWSFQCGYAISTGGGFIALLALLWRTPRGDALACAALIVSLASASQGVGYVAGAVVLLLLQRGPWRRLWTVVVPGLLYLAWYETDGKQYSETHLHLLHQVPAYLWQSWQATLGSVLSISTVTTLTGNLALNGTAIVGVLALLGIAFALWRGWRPGPLCCALIVTELVLWVAAALSNTPAYYRPAYTSRYLSTNAFFLFTALAAGVPRPRSGMDRRLLGLGALLLVAICVRNQPEYARTRAPMIGSDIVSRAELGGLRMMRGTVSPTFGPLTIGDPGILYYVSVPNFLDAYDSYGVDSDSVAQMRAAPQSARVWLDQMLARAELALKPVPQHGFWTGCQSARPAPVQISRPGEYYLRGALTVTAGRFASGAPATVGAIAAGQGRLLTIPRDHGSAAVPWRVSLAGTGSELCGLFPPA